MVYDIIHPALIIDSICSICSTFTTMNNIIVSTYIQPTLVNICKFKKKINTAHCNEMTFKKKKN